MLDFLYDYDMYHFNDGKDYSKHIKDDHLDAGITLCDKLLEPSIMRYGPASVASGCCPFLDDPRNPLHGWKSRTGAAADLVFHDWVNQEKAPSHLCEDMDKNSDIEFDRLITYAGSEFICMGVKKNNNRYAFHENIRDFNNPENKPIYVTHGYTLEAKEKRKNIPVGNRAMWRRNEGETIYHSRRNLRAHHIRVSEYFTLLDFCHSLYGIEHNINTVPKINSTKVIYGARMFGEVLDPIVKEYGRISVLRGLEPKEMREDKNAKYHNWHIHDVDGSQHISVIFTSSVKIPESAFSHFAVAKVQISDKYVNDCGYVYQIDIKSFKILKAWSSGRKIILKNT